MVRKFPISLARDALSHNASTRQHWMDPDYKSQAFGYNRTLAMFPINSILAEHKIFWGQKVHTWSLVLNCGPILQLRVVCEHM